MKSFLSILLLATSISSYAGLININKQNKLDIPDQLDGFLLPQGEKLENIIGLNLLGYEAGDFGMDVEYSRGLITNKLLNKQGVKFSITNNELLLIDHNQIINFGNIEYLNLDKDSSSVPVTQKCKKFSFSRQCFGDIKLKNVNKNLQLEVEVQGQKEVSRKVEGHINGGYIGGMEFTRDRVICFTRFSIQENLRIKITDLEKNVEISFDVNGLDNSNSVKNVNCN